MAGRGRAMLECRQALAATATLTSSTTTTLRRLESSRSRHCRTGVPVAPLLCVARAPRYPPGRVQGVQARGRGEGIQAVHWHPRGCRPRQGQSQSMHRHRLTPCPAGARTDLQPQARGSCPRTAPCKVGQWCSSGFAPQSHGPSHAPWCSSSHGVHPPRERTPSGMKGRLGAQIEFSGSLASRAPLLSHAQGAVVDAGQTSSPRSMPARCEHGVCVRAGPLYAVVGSAVTW